MRNYNAEEGSPRDIHGISQTGKNKKGTDRLNRTVCHV